MKSIYNASVVLPDRLIFGSIDIEQGVIVAVREGGGPGIGIDLQGDMLIPGLIDLHSDHLEKHFVPRGGVLWDPFLAAISHDAQIIGSGITTVFDSLSLTGTKNGVDRAAALIPMIDGLARANDEYALRADHRVHLRCEVTEADTLDRLEAFAGNPHLQLVSLMDHAPGERQFRDTEIWTERYRAATGLSDGALADLMDRQLHARATFGDVNREGVAAFAAKHGLTIASHDDATAEHVTSGARLGAVISEFPTTLVAARAARENGLLVLMGAPNIVRGNSHVGNLSAGDCARHGFLDVLASDYVPGSLMHAAFSLTQEPIGWDPARAIATVTSAPARACGLFDRGEVKVGLRADLVQIRIIGKNVPVVQRVWRDGRRVH
jgi:alpha-D-ribose 1-methylphosphonate 5-triphosphate diphosphatase